MILLLGEFTTRNMPTLTLIFHTDGKKSAQYWRQVVVDPTARIIAYQDVPQDVIDELADEVRTNTLEKIQKILSTLTNLVW